MLSRVGLLFLPLWVCVSNAFADDTAKSAMALWVDSVYNAMSYEQKIGQLIVGKAETPESLEAWVHQQFPLGGLDFPGGDANNIFNKTNLLKSKQCVPLLTIFSQRGNFDDAFPGTISYPSIFTKSSIDAAGAEFLEKKIIAIQKKLGINVSVENNRHLEIIHGEFFINNETAWLGSKGNEITGLKNNLQQQSGILNSINLNISLFDYDFIKHIPKSVYESEGWKNIADNHSIIFVNSLRFRSGWSASKFEKEIVKGLFRKKFEYEGILAVETDAVAQQISPDQLKYNSLDVELINSGFDMIVTSNPFQAYQHLLFAFKNREIKSRDLEEKVKNVLSKKYLIRESERRPLTEDYYAILNSPEIANDIYEAYASSITLLKNDSETIPVRHLETTNFASLMIGGEDLSTFQETLGKYAPFTHFVLPAHDINSESFANLVKKLSAFENVVVGIRAPFHPKVVELLSQLKFETNLITAVFDNQLPDNVYGATNSLLISYEDNDLTQQLVPQMIFGARPCKGIYPGIDDELSTQGLFTEPLGRLAFATSYKSGLDETTLTKIDAIAHEMVNMGAAPGCQVLVARHGNIVYDKTFGYYTYDSLVKVSDNTIYDVASITKVAATTQAIMFLANQGVLDLDEKLSTYLPELANTNKGNLIVRDVLSHQSGLRAFLPLWHETLNLEKIEIPYYSNYPDEEYSNEVAYGMYSNLALRDSIYSWTIKSDLRTKPRYRRYAPYDYKYSDLGFYFMYKLAERLLNQPMDEFLEQNFYQPMGMSGTAFNPLCHFPYMNIAPTEDDKSFRHNLIWGTVHDQIAAMNGGVSGHAGLFSNSLDLAKLGQMHLQGGTYGGQKYFDDDIIKEFTTSISTTNRRGLGWDKPETKSDNSPASKYATGASYGHLGFTGTVIWIDPQYDLVYVFLSNRIFPSMSNNKLNIFNIRTRIHDAIYESIHNFEAKVN